MKIEKWTERRRILYVHHEDPFIEVLGGGEFSLPVVGMPKQVRLHGVKMLLLNCVNPYVELHLIVKDIQNRDQVIFSGRYSEIASGNRWVYYQEQVQSTVTGLNNHLIQSFFPRAIGQYSGFQIYVSPGTVEILQSFDIYFSQF